MTKGDLITVSYEHIGASKDDVAPIPNGEGVITTIDTPAACAVSTSNTTVKEGEEGNRKKPAAAVARNFASNIKNEKQKMAKSSALLQRESQSIAYPRVLRQKHGKEGIPISADLGVGSHAVGAGAGAGAAGCNHFVGLHSNGKNQGRVVSEEVTSSLPMDHGKPASASYSDQEPSTAPSNEKGTCVSNSEGGKIVAPSKEKQSYLSYLDNGSAHTSDLPPEKQSYLSYLDNGSTHTSDGLPEKRSYLSYLDNGSAHAPRERPGAYAGAPGTSLQRLGSVPEFATTSTSTTTPLTPTLTNNNGDLVEVTTRPVAGATVSNNNLVEAMPVSTEFHVSRMNIAEPVGQHGLNRQAGRESKDKKWKTCACGIVVVAFLVVAVSLAVGLTSKKESNNVPDNETPSPTGSPTGALPPMENLELLYDKLPEKTKESLQKSDSPQHLAWEWLLDHPNIASFEEWRKKQIFAMGTFFYSFEGPKWPNGTSLNDRWMDVNTSECSWVLNDDEVASWTRAIKPNLGPAYGTGDLQACNEDGELQTLFLTHFNLPGDVKPSVPPEIELLPSLRILAVAYGQLKAKLSDFVTPELIQLPNLEWLFFQESGMSGTIPKKLRLMTGLRHLVIGGNECTGTIPPEISEMASLEVFVPSPSGQLNGGVPSELGLLTRLTWLDISRGSFTGRIPSELGLMTSLSRLDLDNNYVTGSIPSELGMLTKNNFLYLDSNALTGSIPSELALMTNVKVLWLGNNQEQADGAHKNNFSTSIPRELWEVSHMEELHFSNLPHLSGSFPEEITMPNLTVLSLDGTQVSGTIPNQTCLFIEELLFDCSDLLCGCDCQCVGGSTNKSNPDGWQWQGIQSMP